MVKLLAAERGFPDSCIACKHVCHVLGSVFDIGTQKMAKGLALEVRGLEFLQDACGYAVYIRP